LTKQGKKILSYTLKGVIVILAFTYVYRQVSNNNNLRQFQLLLHSIGRFQVVLIITMVIILMLVNWLLESLKWRYLTRVIAPTSTWKAIEAVFCGLTWAIFTPNRVGEYGGRVMFLPPRKRVHGVFSMIVGSLGQLVITNLLGVTALLWFIYRFKHMDIWLFYGLVTIAYFCLLFMLVFYFNIRWIVSLLDSIGFLRKYHRFFYIMGRYHIKELLSVMGFCAARFFVFSFQYYLLLHMLVPQMPVFEMMMMVFIMFFIQSALPTLDLFDVGVRSMTASAFFTYITTQKIAVIAVVSSIWFINLIVPAILGSIFVFKLKFFDNAN
jgi:hypothetical protein